MSFHSRSHSKPIAPPRRRSSSLTRTSNSSLSSNGRPFSIHGSSINSQLNFPSSSSSFQSSGSYNYGSNQNLRGGNDYHGNDYRRNPYGGGGTLKFPLTSMNTSTSSSSYTSPYKDRFSQNYYGTTNGASGTSNAYTSAYKDRNYFNPYTSYDNGVMTAGLSISGPSIKRDYNSRGSNLLSTSNSGLGGSSSNLMNTSQGIVNIGRSQSLREHERKSRSRKCREAAKNAVPDSAVPYDATASSLSSTQKTLSSVSLHSEGYDVRMFNMRMFSIIKRI